MQIWSFCIWVSLSCQVARPSGVHTADCLRLHLLKPEISIKIQEEFSQIFFVTRIILFIFWASKLSLPEQNVRIHVEALQKREMSDFFILNPN